MKKIFISFRFTGENLQTLEPLLQKISKILKDKNYQTFCSLFLEQYFLKNKMTSNEIYDYCLNKQKEHDTCLFFIRSSDESKGMKMEKELAQKLNQELILITLGNFKIPEYLRDIKTKIKFEELRQTKFYKFFKISKLLSN